MRKPTVPISLGGGNWPALKSNTPNGVIGAPLSTACAAGRTQAAHEAAMIRRAVVMSCSLRGDAVGAVVTQRQRTEWDREGHLPNGICAATALQCTRLALTVAAGRQPTGVPPNAATRAAPSS